MVLLGVKHLMFTDTRKDGTLSGPNFGAIRVFLKEAAGNSVIASGGVTTVEDVVALRDLEPFGLTGIIIGKALYDHKITLQQALQVSGS
jgi:phosphoribosylformimino-5-aminoimidazole carboxamide ribotide isomerase